MFPVYFIKPHSADDEKHFYGENKHERNNRRESVYAAGAKGCSAPFNSQAR